MQRLEEFGMRNVRTRPFKSATFVSVVRRRWRTLNTLFCTALTGIKSAVRPVFRLTLRLLRLA
eukprot:4745983-Amphidinium_carterae.1